MIEYMNEHYGDQFNLFYSTPSAYVDAINSYNVTWPTKYDDMFPYSDNSNAYWTGYFSSRANDKAQVRRGSHNLHSSTQLYAMKMLNQSTSSDEIDDILEANWNLFDKMGVLQHHDAVSGTAKQRIADDYAWRLDKAMTTNNEQYSNSIHDEVK